MSDIVEATPPFQGWLSPHQMTVDNVAVHACPVCGALVIEADFDRHDAWHDQLSTTATDHQ